MLASFLVYAMSSCFTRLVCMHSCVVPHVWLQNSEVIAKCPLIIYGILRRRPQGITAPSAFLVSAASCASITHELLPSRLREATYQACVDTFLVWSKGLDVSPPPVANASRQRAWDAS